MKRKEIEELSVEKLDYLCDISSDVRNMEERMLILNRVANIDAVDDKTIKKMFKNDKEYWNETCDELIEKLQKIKF
jgi:hypothetical protein